MFAIRGAIQVEHDSPESIGAAVRELCAAIVEQNHLELERIVYALFTLSPDLHADFPARAAREHGWTTVPMICAQEIAVPGALPRVCRVMVLVEAEGTPSHVYLRGAKVLRPDLVKR
jgi:chorismate mutase